MNLNLLIKELQDLYASFDDEYKQIAGEPEIMVDVFKPIDGVPHTFQYAGFSNDISIELSDDGVYHIINMFERKS